MSGTPASVDTEQTVISQIQHDQHQYIISLIPAGALSSDQQWFGLTKDGTVLSLKWLGLALAIAP